MSFNRRRWSNELRNSLMNYQSREVSRSNDSLEFDTDNGKLAVDSLDECTNITSMLATLNVNNSDVASLQNQNLSKEHSACTSSTSVNSSKLENDKSLSDLINFSFKQDSNNSKENVNSVPTVPDILNVNIMQKIDASKEHLNEIRSEINHLLSLDERMIECNTLSSDSGTIKLSSSDSSVQSSFKGQITNNQFDSSSFNLNEKISNNITISSGSETIKLSSCNSSSQDVVSTSVAEKLIDGLTEVYSEDSRSCHLFSSRTEFPQNNEEMISMMEEPDVWNDLIALEQALSPSDGQDDKNKSQEPPHILSRLSQKFKETPTRFTEKLVSIIEDSIISESPSKPHSGNNSGISIDRMTGEFRKLCKFIEDESMPDWAPSLVNITTLNKTETPDDDKNKKNDNFGTPKNTFRHIQDTPSKTFTPKNFKCLMTPKNKSGNCTPITNFTPSGDKSFEYWETVCNKLYKDDTEKSTGMQKTSSTPQVFMDEMLTICERQMASLEDSTIDIRSSEPCKKTESELKLKVLNTPRSKSVCKIDSTRQNAVEEFARKCGDDKVNVKLNFSDNFDVIKGKDEKRVLNSDLNLSTVQRYDDSITNEYEDSEDSYVLLTNNVRSRMNENKIYTTTHAGNSPDNSYELLTKNQKSSVHNKRPEECRFIKNKNSISKKDEVFENDFELLPFSPPPQKYREKLSAELLYGDDNDQDCSLLRELATRRQRCLETAKLMQEIDKEDPTFSDEDKTCLETLYKLGIQDKTFSDFEDDKKFMNTLNHCFEYKDYFREKCKPILNRLQKPPDDLKKRATTTIKSKKVLPASSNLKVQNANAKPCKVTVANKAQLLESNNTTKNLQTRVTPRIAPKTLSKAPSTKEKKTSSNFQAKTTKKSPQPKKIIPKNSPSLNLRKTPAKESKLLQPKKVTPRINPKPLLKQRIPSSDQKPLISKSTALLSTSPIFLSPQSIVNSSNDSPTLEKNINSESPIKTRRLFVTPGKSPNITTGRKKPESYFRDRVSERTTPQNTDYNKIQSPLSLYINGTDTNLIQNVQGRLNDLLLTPISNTIDGKNPKLKIKLASKENASPTCSSANIVLPTINYQSAKKVCMTTENSPYGSFNSLKPNSKTKKLLEPIENTVVVRHEGRVVTYNPDSKSLNLEMSIRAQHVAAKVSAMRR